MHKNAQSKSDVIIGQKSQETSGHAVHYVGRGLRKIKANEPGRQKLERRNSWLQAKHTDSDFTLLKT